MVTKQSVFALCVAVVILNGIFYLQQITNPDRYTAQPVHLIIMIGFGIASLAWFLSISAEKKVGKKKKRH